MAASSGGSNGDVDHTLSSVANRVSVVGEKDPNNNVKNTSVATNSLFGYSLAITVPPKG